MDYQQLELNLALSPQDGKETMIKVGDFCFYDDFPYTLIDICRDNALIGDIQRDDFLWVKTREIECLPDKLEGNPGMWRVDGFEGDWESLFKEKNGGDIPDRFLLRNIKDQSVEWFDAGKLEYLGDLKGIFSGDDNQTYPERLSKNQQNKG